VLGSGEINCLGQRAGGPGRTRIQADYLAPSLRVYPETVAVRNSGPPVIWPPEATPSVRIVSVDASATPEDPTAPLVSNANVAIENDALAVIVIETRNFPLEGVVQVRASYKWGGANWVQAAYMEGNMALARWRLSYTFPKGYTTLQARAIAP
jgi:hypothetical protein